MKALKAFRARQMAHTLSVFALCVGSCVCATRAAGQTSQSGSAQPRVPRRSDGVPTRVARLALARCHRGTLSSSMARPWRCHRSLAMDRPAPSPYMRKLTGMSWSLRKEVPIGIASDARPELQGRPPQPHVRGHLAGRRNAFYGLRARLQPSAYGVSLALALAPRRVGSADRVLGTEGASRRSRRARSPSSARSSTPW